MQGLGHFDKTWARPKFVPVAPAPPSKCTRALREDIGVFPRPPSHSRARRRRAADSEEASRVMSQRVGVKSRKQRSPRRLTAQSANEGGKEGLGLEQYYHSGIEVSWGSVEHINRLSVIAIHIGRTKRCRHAARMQVGKTITLSRS